MNLDHYKPNKKLLEEIQKDKYQTNEIDLTEPKIIRKNSQISIEPKKLIKRPRHDDIFVAAMGMLLSKNASSQ
eukprot:UN02123